MRGRLEMKLPDIFYKQHYLEQMRENRNIKEVNDKIIKNLEKKYIEIMNRGREWNKELLFKTSELENKIRKLEEKTKKAEEISECLRLDNEIYKNDNLELSKENAILKETKKMLKASLGGTTKQNNKLQQEIGIMKLKVELMEAKLKEFKLPSPTMSEIFEYERTHKSPRKRKKKELI